MQVSTNLTLKFNEIEKNAYFWGNRVTILSNKAYFKTNPGRIYWKNYFVLHNCLISCTFYPNPPIFVYTDTSAISLTFLNSDSRLIIAAGLAMF